ncbi:MAG: glycosyltransferase family 4 protein [Pseudomonadota bacterium]
MGTRSSFTADQEGVLAAPGAAHLSGTIKASQPTKKEKREKPAVVIVAPNASSLFGGEAVLPVHYFRVLRSRGRKVTLIAHERNEPDLSSIFGVDCPDILYIGDTKWHRAIWRTGKLFPAQIKNKIFGAFLGLLNERFQARMIRQLVAEDRADVIHQPTPVSPKTPSSVYGFGIPVVIGPMNGGMAYPPGYEDFNGSLERYLIPGARAVSSFVNQLIPGKSQAAALLVSNKRTRAALPIRHPNVIELVENGVDLGKFKPMARGKPSPAGSIRLVFMGRLVGWKAVDVSLQALSEARKRGVDATLDILGDGEEMERLKQLRDRLNLEEAVTFHGFQPQTVCAKRLSESDALILNSLFECGGAVVLEAMSIGLPVIASDWGGPADYVDQSTGILVSPCPRESFAARLADAICRLAADPQLRIDMGQAGAGQIKSTYDWDQKVSEIERIYDVVFAGQDRS